MEKQNEDQVAAAADAAAEAAKEAAETTDLLPDTPAADPVPAKHASYEFTLAFLVPILVLCFLTALIWWHELTERPSKDGTAGNRDQAAFAVEEADIAGIHYEFQAGRLSSHRLVEDYQDQIRQLNPTLNAIVETNPDAHQIARAKDRERMSAQQPVGTLHGIPVLLNDDIATADGMNTTAGCDLLLLSLVPKDATVAAQLRRAGAVLLGKASMNKWGGLLDRNWRYRGSECPAGEGAAVAVATNLVTAAVVTERDGAILCSAGKAGVVGIKPTVGLTSRAGLVPSGSSQLSVGPIARTVEDAVVVLDAIVSKEKDPRDSATGRCPEHPETGYTQYLKTGGAAGKRVGVLRPLALNPGALVPDYEVAAFDSHLEKLRSLGAVVVDNLELEAKLLSAVFKGTKDFPETAQRVVLLHEYKVGMDAYLEDLEGAPNDLGDFTTFNFKDFEGERYKGAVKLLEEYTTEGIARLLKEHKLEAMVAPASSQLFQLAAIAGYPGINVPAGYSPKPGKETSPGVPFGLTFVGPACSEPTLIELAFAFEQATTIRKPPRQLADLAQPWNSRVQPPRVKDQNEESYAPSMHEEI